MRRFIKAFTALLALAASTSAMADVSCPFQITGLNLTPDGWVNISVAGSGFYRGWWICPTGGSITTTDGYATRTISSDNCKTIYTQLLTAKATGRRIHFVFHGPADCSSASIPADGTPTLFPALIALVD